MDVVLARCLVVIVVASAVAERALRAASDGDGTRLTISVGVFALFAIAALVFPPPPPDFRVQPRLALVLLVVSSVALIGALGVVQDSIVRIAGG